MKATNVSTGRYQQPGSQTVTAAWKVKYDDGSVRFYINFSGVQIQISDDPNDTNYSETEGNADVVF